MRSTLTFISILFFISAIKAQTSMQPDDIQFLSFRSDAPDGFSFVVWKEISPSTSISFTDNGWSATDSIGFSHTSEGLIVWTNSNPLPKGTVVSIWCDQGNCSSNVGSITGYLGGLSTAGDQIFAFQGRLDSAHFIAAINFDGSEWAQDRLNTNTSALPPTLTGEAFHLNETDNAHFAGIRTGHTEAEYRSWISDMDNSWLSYNGGSIHVIADTSRFVIASEITELVPQRTQQTAGQIGVNPNENDSLNTTLVSKVPTVVKEPNVWAVGSQIFWKNLEQEWEVRIYSTNGGPLISKQIDSTFGQFSLNTSPGVLVWHLLPSNCKGCTEFRIKSIVD